ncbi:MAG: hypothetical protein KAI72_08445 [Candidatus Pacebacteria bacterium]|nr:hypothetical protein [Candidatus Paceibacterota bacterium]
MKIFDYDFYHENRFGSADWADYETLKKVGFFVLQGFSLDILTKTRFMSITVAQFAR